MKNDKLVKCPFCGRIPEIVIEDDEGNVHDEKYEKDPYSGLWYAVKHVVDFMKDEHCLIADSDTDIRYGRDIGNTAFPTREDAIEFWNSNIRKVIKKDE